MASSFLPAAAADKTPAKVLFSQVITPADLSTRTVGFYARGCLAGARALPVDGPDWQVMRLSRDRYWGTPELVAFVEKLAEDSHLLDGWPGLLVGDMSQPRGGPMPSGHASHQIGLDVDIWLTPMPDRILTPDERETISATSFIKPGTHTELNKAAWTEGQFKLIERAASYPEVERIFVNPGIKKALCEKAGSDRAWLHKVRPWFAHDDHFHVRLACPKDQPNCREQDPVPRGDGCGSDLAWWLGPIPWMPKLPGKPAPPLTLTDLPAACEEILKAAGLPPSAAGATSPIRAGAVN